MAYYGLVEQNAAFMEAAEVKQATEFDQHYMRMALRFKPAPPSTGGSCRASSSLEGGYGKTAGFTMRSTASLESG